MLRKVISYKDFNGNEQQDVCYFNLTKTEVMEMELETTGGMSEMLKNLIETKDSGMIMKIIKNIILKSYGEKSPDGKRFIKSDDLSAAFRQTNAYDELFMELLQDKDALENFMMGVLPDVGKSKEEIKALAESQMASM